MFHSMLTQDNTNDIERIQKIVLRVILDDKYTDYHNACLQLNVQNLQVRRTKLSLNFALKCVESEKFSHLFKHKTNTCIRDPDKFDVSFARTTRYMNSPRLYLTRLLNSFFRKNTLKLINIFTVQWIIYIYVCISSLKYTETKLN